MSKIDYLHASP